MKILCNSCEAAEGKILCCADEAALCVACDRDVHAANRLAGKHQRLPLIAPAAAGGAAASGSAAAIPKCDICQEFSGYFFCLEDRALLCRSCDVAIHAANTFVSAHRRFLVTGVQVGSEFTDPPPAPTPAQDDQQLNNYRPASSSGPSKLSTKSYHKQQSSSSLQLASGESNLEQVVWPSSSATDMAGSIPDWCILDQSSFNPQPKPAAHKRPRGSSPNQGGRINGGGMISTTSKGLSLGGFMGNLPDWPLDDFFGFPEFGNNNNNFGFTESGTSKADSGKFGSSEGSPNYRSLDEGNNNAEDFFGQVPEIPWTVPELPSPPTASGLHWQRNYPQRRNSESNAAFVPDICLSGTPFGSTKRRRR